MKPKIGDVFVYIFIVLLVGFSFWGLKAMAGHGTRAAIHIELDGKLVESIELSSSHADGAYREIQFDTDQGGYNTIRISPQGVDVVDSSCPDKLCVSSPRIKRPGQSIVCIPHRFVVRIVGQEQGDSAVNDTAF